MHGWHVKSGDDVEFVIFKRREESAHLKPPRNVRDVLPRVCSNCKHFQYGAGRWVCVRPSGPTGDTGDGYQHMTTCDYFKQ